MTNQPATASQKTDEVTNKTTTSMTVDTIFSVTGFSPLQCVAMEREHSCPQHPVDKAQKSQHAHPEPALVVNFLQHVRKWMCLQVSELLTLRGKISFQLKDPFLRLSTQGSQPDDPGCRLLQLQVRIPALRQRQFFCPQRQGITFPVRELAPFPVQ